MSKDVLINQNGTSPRRNGEYVVVEGRDATRHRLRLRLMWGAGEFDLDTSIGVPYIEVLQEKPPQIDRLRGAVISALNDDPVVNQVSDIDIEVDHGERELRVTATVKVDEDEELTVQGSVEV